MSVHDRTVYVIHENTNDSSRDCTHINTQTHICTANGRRGLHHFHSLPPLCLPSFRCMHGRLQQQEGRHSIGSNDIETCVFYVWDEQQQQIPRGISASFHRAQQIVPTKEPTVYSVFDSYFRAVSYVFGITNKRIWRTIEYTLNAELMVEIIIIIIIQSSRFNHEFVSR